MVSEALLSFSLTPVQRFIEAARTVRDLKAGSKLLSHLTWQALSATGGKPMFPAVSLGGSEPDSIPNLFLMRFDSIAEAEDAADAARDAVQDRWVAIADCVRARLAAQWPTGWDADWDDQINSFWTITTVVMDTADAADVCQKMAGGVPSGMSDLGVQFTAISGLLVARKRVRRFVADHGAGRHKCSMMGDLEQMGPVGLGAPDAFWQRAVGTSVSPAMIREHDRLCAVSLVKRFCHCAPGICGLSRGVEETAQVAAGNWWRQAEELAAEATQGFAEAHTAVKSACPTAETQWRCLLVDSLTPEGVSGGSAAVDVAPLRKARNELLNSVKDTLGEPPRYYGIIALDGDHMGKWLSGEKRGGDVDLDFWQSMSGQLREYAEVVPNTVEEYGGYPVYAGGDDVLALTPLSTALPLAQTLRGRFPQFDPGSAPSTASAGLAILHYQHDLRAGLRAARRSEHAAKSPDDEDIEVYRRAAQRAEEVAKREGRNALGIALLKRSGADVELVIEWEQVPALLDLQRLFAAGLSDRWLYRLARTLPDLHPDLDRAALGAVVAHSVKRIEVAREDLAGLRELLQLDSAADSDAVRQALREHVATQFADWQGRAPGRVALERFIKFGMIASFLQRGRD